MGIIRVIALGATTCAAAVATVCAKQSINKILRVFRIPKLLRVSRLLRKIQSRSELQDRNSGTLSLKDATYDAVDIAGAFTSFSALYLEPFKSRGDGTTVASVFPVSCLASTQMVCGV